MKGYEKATQEEINDRLRIDENYQEQVRRIIKLRHLCNLSLDEAAEVTTVSSSSLSRYENEVTKFNMESFITICSHYEKYLYLKHIDYDKNLFQINICCLYN